MKGGFHGRKVCFVTGYSHLAIDLLQRAAILAGSEIWSIIEK
jgi:hypothetical protein